MLGAAQISKLGAATDTIDVIMLNSTIHDHFLNSYCTQSKTVKIFHVMNLASCELWPMNQSKWLQTTKQQQIRWANDIIGEQIRFVFKNVEFGVIHIANNLHCLWLKRKQKTQ